MIQSITGNTPWYKTTSVGNVGTSTLSVARTHLAAASVGNYVLFAGGYDDKGCSNVVDIFKLKEDGTLEKLTDGTLSLSTERAWLAAVTVGNYVLFGGGRSNDECSNVVDIFKLKEDGTFERLLDGTLNLSVGREGLAAATVRNCVIFGGGRSNDGCSNIMDIFRLKEDGTFEKLPDGTLSLSVGREDLAVTTVGNYVLFAGGYDDNGCSNVVDIFKLKEDGTLEKLTDGTLSLSAERAWLAAVTVGNYALFGGGFNNIEYSSVVDIFKLKEDGTFERLLDDTLNLSVGRESSAAATIGSYVLFGGGWNYDGYSDVVDIFRLKEDGTLEKLPDGILSLSVGREDLAVTTVGNYVLFSGGCSNNGCSNVVDIFSEVTVCWKTKISVPGIKKSDMAAYNIVLNDNRETAMRELHEYEKISYVELLDDAIEVTCLEETPSIDLKIRLKV